MAKALTRSAFRVTKKQKSAFIAPLTTRQKSNESNILKSVFNDIPKNNYTVNDFIWQNLDRWPDKTATVCAVTGHGYTYAQTHRMSVSFAASLRTKLKLKNDDKVAIILPNVPEYPCTILGVLQAGCIASMMNPVYTSHELSRQLQLIDCKGIISSKLSYPNIQEALKDMKVDIPVILTDHDALPEGTIKFAEFAEDLNVDIDCLKKVLRSPKDVAILPFSSGTTGFPKAVELTHASVVALNQMIADPEIIVVQETTATHQAVLPAILPFFHIFGFNALMINQMSLGCKLVTLPYFKPELFLKTLVNYKAEVLFIVPPMVVFLGKHPAVTPAHVESLTGIISGAAPLSASDAAAVISKNKNIIFRQGYGLTETNGAVSVGHRTDTNHAAVGHVLGSMEVKIADLQTQEALGPGQEGEIWCRGPNNMSGYYLNETASKEVLTEDGWFKTGDIGKYDENKYLYVTDRLKELIKVKGFQVPPAELETILRTHPKILDCAVLGISDPITGEIPKAFVVPQAGQTLEFDEVLEYVNCKVTTYKKIKEESAETKKAYTYLQLEKNISTFATSLLKKLGLKPGDVVAVMLPNCPEFPVVAFGTMQAGCVLTTVNPIYKEFELTHQLSLTEPKIIVTIPQCYDIVVKGMKGANNNSRIVLIDSPNAPIPDGTIRYSEVAENGEADYSLLDKIEKNPDDVACIPFSSGTTGLPKGVEITYENLLGGMETMHVKENCFPIVTHGNNQDILPCFLPFFHIYGLVVGLFGHLTKGCKMITIAKFSASTYLDILKEQPCSLLYIVPPIAILLGKHPDVKEDHFRNVRHIICGAAPLAASDVDSVFEKSKRKFEFNQGFGATETCALTTTTVMGAENVDYSSCGVPMANVKLKFVDPLTGKTVPIGESGEMYVQGPTVMKGYHKNPKATEDSMTDDGYFKTGDLGHYKPGVGLFITDRIKELIKVKGMQVAPAELESLLRSHPAVQDAAVIGVPHEFYGEAPRAFIIKKGNQKISSEELQDFVASKVAVYKKIEEVIFVDDIPKTASGKILRKELKKMYA